MITNITTEQFNTLITASSENIILDFYSSECPPCEALAPILEDMAATYGEHLTVYKINRQENRELALQLDVRSSPTLLFYKAGVEVGTRLSGVITKSQLLDSLLTVFGIKEVGTSLKSELPETIDVLILGAGPAGLAAAIYTARAGKKTVVLKGKATSRLEMAHLVENYPGLPPITGKDLLQVMEKQAIGFGAQIIKGDVLELALGSDPKMVTTRGDFFSTKTLIMAMGKGQNQQSIENEERFVGMGVSYCATCDGAFYRGKNVVVYGNDHEALDDALMLKQLGCNTTLISYCKSNQCPSELIEQAKIKGVHYIPNAKILSVQGASMVSQIEIQLPEGKQTLDTDVVFIIQEVPSQAVLQKAGVSITSKDCIAVDREMKTNLPGVFAAGDVTCGGLQIAIATGEGVSAALSALRYIRKGV